MTFEEFRVGFIDKDKVRVAVGKSWPGFVFRLVCVPS